MLEKLDSRAHNTVVWIYKDIERSSIVNDICVGYLNITKSPELKHLQLDRETLDEETKNRILFEILCFASFLTSDIILKYVTTRKFLKKTVDEEAALLFNKNVKQRLNEICNTLGLCKIYDFGVISIDPEIKVGPTELLNPNVRLIEYAKVASQDRGKVLTIFSKNTAKFLALENYPLFEPLTASYAKPIYEIANRAMKGVFGY